MPNVSVNGALRARAHEKITATTSSVGFTASNYVLDQTTNDPFSGRRHAVEALITVETADIRWTCDGTTPTVTAGTALGHIASDGDAILISGHDNIKAFRAINAVASNGATLRVTFYFQ